MLDNADALLESADPDVFQWTISIKHADSINY